MKFPSFLVRAAHSAAGNLRQLVDDRRGNAFVIVAAAVVPMLALVGGGIDMSRGYLARARLQQACDAGVLATRKRLGATVVTNGVVPSDALAAGRRFFDLNYQDGAYGSTGRTFTQTFGSDYSINGTATVEVPTTLMRLFGSMTLPVSVACTAQFNYANTDIMMVLDTTGSMASVNSGDTKSRIAVLRDTVKTFYSAVTGNNNQGVRIRFGFVPYSTNVNVGYLLKSKWMASQGYYEGRDQPSTFARWTYASMPINVSSFKGATGDAPYVGGTITVKMEHNTTIFGLVYASNRTSTFQGCIEERATYVINDYNNVDLDRARDLDIDSEPDPNNADTQWRPVLPGISYLRKVGGAWSPDSVDTYTDFDTGDSPCPTRARKLGVMTATEVANYVDGLNPTGNTYHDIGMIWGGRLLSPTGIFASENAEINGRPTMRHLIFLTDGQTETAESLYGTYGVEPLSRRRWFPGSGSTLNQTVERRFAYACDQVKNRNITVWVIGFGTTVTNLMKNCSGNGRWFQANNAAELSNAFSQIASAIGDLRITK